MDDGDFLLKLSVDESELERQFARIEETLKRLGGNGISSSLAGSFDKLSLSLDTSTAAMIRLQESMESLGTASARSFTARNRALQDATTAENNLSRAVKERASAEEQANRASVNYAALGGNPWAARERTKGPGVDYNTLGGNPYSLERVLSTEKEILGVTSAINSLERQKQQTILATIDMVGRLRSEEAASLAFKKETIAIEKTLIGLEEQRAAAANQSAYSGMLRSLHSDVERSGGLKKYGQYLIANVPEFKNFDNGQMKSYLTSLNSLLEANNMKLRERPNMFEREIGYIGRTMIAWGAVGATFEALNLSIHTFEQSLKEASEVQVQGVLFQGYQSSLTNSGQKTDLASSNSMTQEAIRLAATYGDNVSDVVQDLELWYKRTGDLTSASYMTAQALKFQVATGTELEDTYRTLTALGSQLAGEKMGFGFTGNFDLSRTRELLELITAFSVRGGAGMHIFTAQGAETDKNAALHLQEALEQDGEALKSLGFNITQTLALDQLLITSMGNTKQGADEAAEKIARLAGGIAGLSNPGKNQALARFGIDLSGLTTAQTDTQKMNVLEQEYQIYKKLTPEQKNYLATTEAGNRQYQSLMIILDKIPQLRQAEIDALHNLGLEDQIAANMQDTYKQSVNRLEGAWQGLEIALGQRILPTLTSAIQSFTQNTIPLIDSLISKLGLISGITGGLTTAGVIARFVPNPALKAALLIGGGTIGGLMGQQSDARNAEIARYGEGYEKYRDEISRIPETGPHRDVAIRMLSAGAREAYGTKLRRDTEVAQFNALLGTGVVYGTRKNAQGKEEKYPRFLSGADLYAAHHPEMLNMQEVQDAESREALKNQKIYSQIQSDASVPKGIPKDKSEQGEGGPLTMPGGMPLKDYQIFGEQLADIKAKYQDLNEANNEGLTNDQRRIDSVEKLSKAYGINASYVDQMSKAIEKKKSDDQHAIDALKGQEGLFTSFAASAQAKAKAAGFGTEEGKGFLTQYYAAESEARRVRGEINRLGDDMDALDDKAAQFKETITTTDLGILTKSQDKTFNTLDNAFRNAISVGDKQALSTKLNITAQEDHKDAVDLINTAWYDGNITLAERNRLMDEENLRYDQMSQTAKDAAKSTKEFTDNLESGLRKSIAGEREKGFDVLLGMSGGDADTQRRITQIKEILKVQKEYADFTEEYNRRAKESAGDNVALGLLNQWRGVTQATLQAEIAAADYKAHLDEIKNTPWFKGLESMGGDIFKNLAASIDNIFSGKNHFQDTITSLDEYVRLLEKEKEVDTEAFDLRKTHSAWEQANYKLEEVQLNQKINLEKSLAQQTKDRENFQFGVRGYLGNFEKSFMDQYIKQIQDSLTNGFLKQPGQDAQTKALNDYAAETRTHLVSAMQMYSDTTNKLVDALVGGGGASGNFTDTSSNLTDALTSTMDKQIPGALANSPVFGNADQTKQNIGGGSLLENLTKSGGLLAALGMSIGASGYSEIGNILGLAGGQFKGGASTGKFGAGADLSMLGTVLSSFGGGPDQGVGSLLGMGLGLLTKGVGGPAGAIIGSLLGQLLGPHYSEAKNPDMYGNSGFAQMEANAVGKSYTSTNGNVVEDQSLQSALGGQSQLSYIDQFVKAHPGGSGLTGASLALWQQANQMTGGGVATTTGYGGQAGAIHNGQQELMTANGQAIGNPQAWQDLYTNIGNVAQQLMTFQGALGGANQSLVVFNAYGNTYGMPGAWNTPGYAANPANYPGPGNTNLVPGPPTNAIPSTPAPPSVNRTLPSTQPAVINTSVQLNSKTIATAVQSVNLQFSAMGYQRVS